MAKVGGYWREAATVVIAAKSDVPTSAAYISKSLQNNATSNIAVKHLKHYDYKILMLKRSKKNKFLPENYVFPGGTISNSDFHPDWIELYESYSGSVFSQIASGFQTRHNFAPIFKSREQITKVPAEIAFRICALRECFEECGILLVRKMDANKKSGSTEILSSSDLNLSDWRKRVHGDADQFLRLCKENKLIPDIWCLYEWCNWLTPVMYTVDKPPERPSRFDTIFFICCLDKQPRARVDNREAVTAQWQSPGELIEQHYKDKITMIGPQLYELSRLCNFAHLTELREFAKVREVHGIERWMPVIVICKDGMLTVLPGDGLYPANPDYDGTKQVLRSDKTMEELKQITSKWNRSQRSHGSKWAVQCNIEQVCGHIAPIEDIYIAEGKL